MEIKRDAIAGTLESSDVQIMISPSDELNIQLKSSVIKQYGDQIIETIEDVLSKLEVSNATVSVQDQGALDCTIRARVQTAVLRASEFDGEIPWGTKL